MFTINCASNFVLLTHIQNAAFNRLLCYNLDSVFTFDVNYVRQLVVCLGQCAAESENELECMFSMMQEAGITDAKCIL